MELNTIHRCDCIEGMRRLPRGTIDLVFADPPFNIGYEYDVYDDRQEAEAYLAWSRNWIAAVHAVLKPTGTFWLAIGDEFAAELKLISQEVGFHCRSWVIWYYTFGVNCERKFSRSHAHLFHFVKDARQFTFNDHAIRVPSARMLVYADARANPMGRLPDDTWILRPQDLAEGFTAEEDCWYFPRVAGTFKERAGFHGCQMPEQLLGRIIRACSNPGEMVLDPFAGSATTLAVAKKLGRQWMGFEISPEYVARGTARLAEIAPGDALKGAAEPLISVPASETYAVRDINHGREIKRRLDKTRSTARRKETKEKAVARSLHAALEGILQAYRRCYDGFSVDRVVADPELNQRFIENCRQQGLEQPAAELNRLLFRLRKAGKLAHLPAMRRTEFTPAEYDQFLFASEIALRQTADATQRSLDEILCDPQMAAEFDRRAQALAPGFTPLSLRWGALRLRKEAHAVRGRLERAALGRFSTARAAFEVCGDDVPNNPGVYLVQDGPRKLYAGATWNLRQRFKRQFKRSLRGVWMEFAQEPRVAFAALSQRELASLPTNDLLARQGKLIQEHRPKLNFLFLAGA